MVRFVLLSGACLASAVAGCNRAPPAGGTPSWGKTIQTGVASFYGEEFAGKETVSGEPLKLSGMTAASRTSSLGARVQEVDAETGQSATVRIVQPALSRRAIVEPLLRRTASFSEAALRTPSPASRNRLGIVDRHLCAVASTAEFGSRASSITIGRMREICTAR